MNLLTAVLIDDDPIALADLKLEMKTLKEINIVACYTNVLKAIEALDAMPKVDVVFCDIDMPRMTGIEAANLLKPNCRLLVFCTGYLEYTQEAFEVWADGYLLKPVMEQDIRTAIGKLEERSYQQERLRLVALTIDHVMVTPLGESGSKKVKLTDISRFVRTGNYVSVFTDVLEGMTQTSIKHIYEKYKDTGLFMLANHSTLVAYNKISLVENSTVVVSGQSIEITEMGRKDFERYLDRVKLNR